MFLLLPARESLRELSSLGLRDLRLLRTSPVPQLPRTPVPLILPFPSPQLVILPPRLRSHRVNPVLPAPDEMKRRTRKSRRDGQRDRPVADARVEPQRRADDD